MAPTMEYALFFSIGLNAAYIKLGDAEGALGNIQDAQSHYQLAIDSLGVTTFLGQGNIAGEAAYAYLAEGKLKLGDSETLKGNVQQAEHHYREAIADCRQLIALVPKKVSAFYTRGRAKAALSDHTGAIADFERVIAIKPDHALAYYARGLAKQAREQHDTGDGIELDLRDLAALIEQEVNQILDQDITVEIEQDVNQGLGQDTPAEADFQKAKALNPDVEKLYPFSDGSVK